VNIIEASRHTVIGLVTVGGCWLLLSASVAAQSADFSGDPLSSTAVSLSAGPSVAAERSVDNEAEVQPAALRPALYLPYVQQPSESDTLPRFDDTTERMRTLLNVERAAAGCGPVTIDEKLMRAAQAHSEDMAEHGFLDHLGTDGSWPHERIQREGYDYVYVGESIARTVVDDAGHVLAMWMNSPGHRAILMNCTAQEMGLGHVTPYWTIVLAKPR